METIALFGILIAFIYYVYASMQHQQKMIDKILAEDYKEYKAQERADQQLKAEVSEMKLQKEEIDTDYL